MIDSRAPIRFHRWSPRPSPSTERLKAAILLGQQMAEQGALSMLTAKVRQAMNREHGAEDAQASAFLGSPRGCRE
jgi:hypothetical protein